MPGLKLIYIGKWSSCWNKLNQLWMVDKDNPITLWCVITHSCPNFHGGLASTPWASYQIRKIAGCACAGNAGNVSPAAEFKGKRELAIPACITARASRTCRDACRDCLPAVAGKTFPAFLAHAHPQFDVFGKRPIEDRTWVFNHTELKIRTCNRFSLAKPSYLRVPHHCNCEIHFTNCGLVIPYAVIKLGQHELRKWLVAWQHRAITWTNVDSSSL